MSNYSSLIELYAFVDEALHILQPLLNGALSNALFKVSIVYWLLAMYWSECITLYAASTAYILVYYTKFYTHIKEWVCCLPL